MERSDVFDRFNALWDRALSGPIGTSWHWLNYHFRRGTLGSISFTPRFLGALIRADEFMPGYAEAMISRLEQIHGREKNPDDYNTILQLLAEVLVIDHLVQHEWPTPATFEMEPTAGRSKKNPEVVIHLATTGSLGVEVKSPNLEKHSAERGQNRWQVNARDVVALDSLAGGVTKPRDNPVKSFLESADEKFQGFRESDPGFRSVLFIVWDDFINEPLTALLAPSSGLFTTASFAVKHGSERHPYPNVDAVVLLRHQHQFRLGLADKRPVDERHHLLDYGSRTDFPPHALIPNPAGKVLNQPWLDALGAWDIADLGMAGSEYRPGEVVLWTNSGETESGSSS